MGTPQQSFKDSHNAKGRRTDQELRSVCGFGSHCRPYARFPRHCYKAVVGLHKRAQVARPRKQAVFHPGQKNGQGLWRGQNPRVRHGQVSVKTPVLTVLTQEWPELTLDTSLAPPLIQLLSFIYNNLLNSPRQKALLRGSKHSKQRPIVQLPLTIVFTTSLVL